MKIQNDTREKRKGQIFLKGSVQAQFFINRLAEKSYQSQKLKKELPLLLSRKPPNLLMIRIWMLKM